MMRNLSTLGLTDIEKSVVKATYEDDLQPKEKHVIFLIQCSRDYDILSHLEKRLTLMKWNIVYKTLIVIHRLCIEGSDRFVKDAATHHHLFQISSFFDPTDGTQDHQTFMSKYADYLNQKLYSFKLLGVSIERSSPSESKKWGEEKKKKEKKEC